MEQLILNVVSKHVEEKKFISSTQHGFTNGKSCLANLIEVYDGMTGWVDEGRTVDLVYLGFGKAFNTVSYNILLGKLRKCTLDEWTMRCIENSLNDRSQCVVISSTDSSSGLQLVVFPKGQYWFQSCSIYSPMTWMKGQSVLLAASLLIVQS